MKPNVYNNNINTIKKRRPQMKTIDELKQGECQIITKQGKVFKGFYSEEYEAVFFTIPSNYEIIGYIQD